MGKGSFIDGRFVQAKGEAIQSFNPAHNYEAVFESNSDLKHVDKAVKAAEQALPSWRALSQESRNLLLKNLETAFKRREEDLAKMMTREMGKVWSESILEAKNVANRIGLTIDEALKRVATEHPAGVTGETRYHSQGVLAVLGPYNFPAHLMSSHIIPALLTGNTIVAKPSEVTPGVGEIYAECFEEAGLPPGVFNMLQGRGDIGKALVTHPKVRGVLFTGSYSTGRALKEALLDHPHKILALEMGSKNTVVVLNDADLYQAMVEITQGAFQSAGQRCTATSRVLIDKHVADKLIPSLVKMASEIKPGDPTNPDTVLGPLAGKIALKRYLDMLKKLKKRAGVEVLLEAKTKRGGAFVTPSIYQVKKLWDEELFGPHYDIQVFDDVDEAVKLVNESAYGLSNSVFTRSEAKFERFYRETSSGVLNWNRSTNGLSGRAPFGGCGKSGNFRPAGIDAVRNATYPVMVQTLAFGEPAPLKPLALQFESERENLTSSLDDLLTEHERELKEEQRYRYFDTPQTPVNLRLPASDIMRQRLYRGNLVPHEKKEPVIDLYASRGPYLTSIDEVPLVLFDAASQIASLGLGFQGGPYQKALDEGRLTPALLSNHAPDLNSDVEAFEKLLLSRAHSDLKHVTFTTSGAAAVEKAFDLCRMNGPGGQRIIAFEGSFHGRSMMSLQATYNPAKRAGFEMAGYEATFLPFGELDGLREELKRGGICAVIIEPVQCEGGEKFASIDFFRGVRAITAELKIPLIFDEIQTGFGLFGPFFYHTSFGLEIGPDCVAIAKKAQVGGVLSRWKDSRPEQPHLIQVQKGLLQADAILKTPYRELEKLISDHLSALHESFPDLVLNPRSAAYGFAFDMPTPAQANNIVNQRFKRGFMAYIAGTRTLRFRVNVDTTIREIEFLFKVLKDALDGTPPDYKHPPSLNSLPLLGGVSIEALNTKNWSKYVSSIQLIEQTAYEPSRQDSMEYLESWLKKERSIGLVALYRKEVIGFAIGGPLEHSQADGPMQDPMRNRENTFYSTNIVLREDFHNKGIGYHLKKAQVDTAKKLDYQFMTGRNRTGFTHDIQRINKSFGAYEVATYQEQYGGSGEAIYYRIPLERPKVYSHPGEGQGPVSLWRRPGSRDAGLRQHDSEAPLDWSNSIQAPLGKESPELLADIERGVFTSAVGTKLTLGNFITPDFVRYTELLRHFMPKACQHLYFTSGRDEMVDKGLRSLRFHRQKAQVAIGLRGQYLGHTTAAARSLSDPGDYKQPFGWFDWPLLNSPKEIRAEINKLGAENIFGIIIEPLGEMTGQLISNNALKELEVIRSETGVPLVFVESASSLGRSGKSMFLSDNLPIQPNMVWWYAGGQLGHVFVDEQYFVSKPLTLISTWDGDEISMRRTYRHLVEAKKHLERGVAKKFEGAFRHPALDAGSSTGPRIKSGVTGTGLGLWRAFDLGSPEKAHAAQSKLKEAGLLLSKGFGGKLIACPPICVTDSELERGVEILKEHLPEC